MQAALSALTRLQTQLAAAPQPAEEWQCSLPDPWKRQLFPALVRRHGLHPCRRPRQRHSTVMVRTTRAMVDQILWPQHLQRSTILHDYLDDANQIISRSVHAHLPDAPEQPNLLFS